MHNPGDSNTRSRKGTGARAGDTNSSIATLSSLLADTVEGMRWLAAVLGGGSPRVTLHSLWHVRWAWASVCHLPRGGWAAFMRELAKREHRAGCQVCVPLVSLALRLADTPNRAAAFAAAVSLKEWGHPQGMASVLGQLGASDPDHRARVVRYLGECEDPSLVGHLLPVLEDPSERVRVEAVRATARCGGYKAVAHLRFRMSEEPSPEVRAIMSACIGLLQARASSEP